jgi:hypothetical protein
MGETLDYPKLKSQVREWLLGILADSPKGLTLRQVRQCLWPWFQQRFVSHGEFSWSVTKSAGRSITSRTKDCWITNESGGAPGDRRRI